MTRDPRRRPVTDEQRARSAKALAQLARDVAASAERPGPTSPPSGKFTGALGLDIHGNPQRPLSPDERAHKEDVIRRALGARHSTGTDDADRPELGHPSS